jgi:hypothetical protein
MSWESDERDAALWKLEQIRQMCEWVEKRRLPAHRMTIAGILSLIEES